MAVLRGNALADDRIAIIGAGMAGIAMGVQLKRLLKHENFCIYEKGNDIGGTWTDNRYPNLSCDVVSEFYSFSFFQKPDWSEKYAQQREILDYIHDCARHFQLESHIALQQECRSVSWSESERLWTLSLWDIPHEKSYVVQARYIVTAMGVLNIPNGLSDLPVLTHFGGPVFHTSQWRETDFRDKRVMVIGNGCSANQVVPWILNNQRPRTLVQIVRSEQWVAPKNNYRISTFTKWCLRHIPFAMKVRRLWAAYQLDRGFVAYRNTTAGAKARNSAAESVKSYMRSVANPTYHHLLIPRYDLGAKRPVMDHGYLEATNRPNFTLIKCDGIRSVESSDKKTVVDAAGNRHDVDIIILANGFQTQDLLSPMEVRGIKDQDLRALWQQRGGSEAYMGVTVHGFPNFFMLAGPNTLPSSNSTLHGIECSVVYITRILRGIWGKSLAQRADAISVMPTAEAETQFNAALQADIKGLIYTSHVHSWYINKETGKNTLIWPGTQFSFWWNRCVTAIKWTDWIIERHS
ncbi:FAD/NAD(P)-binding domain-containing protein [Nemania abortiva]|nr:FAD/NAD(P)-binding domain-containing protein [Nemania abortiva]